MKRSTIIAVVLLLLLGGLAYYLNQQPSPTADEPATTAVPTSYMLINLVETDIHNIRLQMNEWETVIGRDTDGLWILEKPVNDSIDLAGLEVQVTNLMNLKVSKNIESDLKDQDVGLDHPTLNVSITMRDGSSHQLQIGSKNPFGNSYYARKDGKGIVLLSSTTVEDIIGFVRNVYTTPTPSITDGDITGDLQATITPSATLSQ